MFSAGLAEVHQDLEPNPRDGFVKVSKEVGNVRNQGPQLIELLSAASDVDD